MAEQRVGILMGSISDADEMSGAIKALDELGIPHEVKVASAHRSPDVVTEYARGAKRRGVAVIIAGAGGAAHLAGVVAAHTSLPVIGVPMSSGALNGLDALLSTVNMPPGVPVATMGIGAGGAKNAGLLAARMLAIGNKALAKKLEAYRKKLARKVKAMDADLNKSLKK